MLEELGKSDVADSDIDTIPEREGFVLEGEFGSGDGIALLECANAESDVGILELFQSAGRFHEKLVEFETDQASNGGSGGDHGRDDTTNDQFRLEAIDCRDAIGKSAKIGSGTHKVNVEIGVIVFFEFNDMRQKFGFWGDEL